MNVGIFGSTRKEYIDKTDLILETLNKEDILYIITGKLCDTYEICMKNGDIYRGLLASNYARGYCWHKVYVSSTVNDEMFSNVIYPKILDSEIPENERVIYY